MRNLERVPKFAKEVLATAVKGTRRHTTCHGVRIEDAELIVYPGRPAWLKVCDLTRLPYKLHSLPADGPFATGLEAELENPMTAGQFKPREK